MDNRFILTNQFGEVSINRSAEIGEQDAVVSLDHSVGDKTFKCFRIKDQATLFVPAIAIADGGGAALLAAAGEIPADYRPAVDVKFAICVVDDAITAQFGSLVVGADGSLAFYADAGTTGFTNAAAASIPATAVSYSLL